MSRAREGVSDLFYSDINPLTSLRKNLSKKITETANGFKEGLTMTGDMAEMAGSANDAAQMMGGKGYLVGSSIGSFLRDKAEVS